MAVDLGWPTAKGRSCSGCTKCCEGWLPTEVAGHKIYEGSPCVFVDAGKGCTQYDKRPEDPCKTFKCLWLVSEEVPEEFKPSLSNVILMVEETAGYRYILAKETGEKMPAEVVAWLFGQAINSGNNICFQIDKRFYWYGSDDFGKMMTKKYGGTKV